MHFLSNVRSSVVKKCFLHMKYEANRHDYDNIFSVCVLYAAHGIFITIKDVYKQCGV